MQSIVNRIKLIKLYSVPEIFDSISFKDGLNIILGEKYDDATTIGRKTNGVGKSICIEFINFCLLKEYDKSRISKIPPKVLNDEVNIILELEIGNIPLIINRNIKSSDQPSIIYNGKEQKFEKLEDAIQYLENLTYQNGRNVEVPTYRTLISVVMREETSGFNNILKPFDAKVNIPENPRVLLYMLNIDLHRYSKIMNILKDIESTKDKIVDLKNKLTKNKTVKLDDVRAELNALDDQVNRMAQAIESAKSMDSFETIQGDLIKLEDKMERLRTKQQVIRYEMNKIQSLPMQEKINIDEIKVVYEFFKEGLGNVIEKSLDEVIKFKQKVENYQNTLIKEKYKELEENNRNITEMLRTYDDEYSEKIKIIDDKGILSNIKNSIKIYADKSKELGDKTEKIKSLDSEEAHLKAIKTEKSTNIIELDKEILNNRNIVKSFSDTFYDFHEIIMGNRECYFNISTLDNNDKSKKIINVAIRIYDDGSFSVDRVKVFLYDISLLFNNMTRIKHPKLLIHDNIFSVDQDTLIQSLNFLSNKDKLYNDFQYIVTLNRDMLQNQENELKFKIEEYTIATFTKENKFLKTNYQELYKK